MESILLAHWCKLIENIQFSTMEFYAIVERMIKKREVPALLDSLVEWKEGGMFSMNRIYLRLARHRLYFEICAAPFGTGFFVSSRLIRRVLRLTVFQIVLLFVMCVLSFFLVLLWSSIRRFGFDGGALFAGTIFGLFVCGIYCIVLILRNINSLGLARLDEFLMDAPFIGSTYEALFHPMTFYHADQILMYQQAVHNAVMEAIDDVLKSKTLKPLTELERKPVFEGLIKR